MMNNRLLLLKELQELAVGLKKGNKLLLKQAGIMLKCQFVMGGLVRYVVEVKSQPLVKALLQKSLEGIIAGEQYSTFVHGFEAMALHVKAKALFKELDLEQTELRKVAQYIFVA